MSCQRLTQAISWWTTQDLFWKEVMKSAVTFPKSQALIRGCSHQEIIDQFDVNFFFSQISVLHAALPSIRARQFGVVSGTPSVRCNGCSRHPLTKHF
ncbi:hypothetical protein BDW42DRAFT_164925 [Aspergillus taichungensis]|uniref:Uncharacterized protein n=1 Tax=Aspergillus taichungensis TaxID=482145 RepID=A0A2J5I0Y3_9EURO|nr:hypothetical protein BDW42DRAFT_164925 [Aspergillus taichungensis]